MRARRHGAAAVQPDEAAARASEGEAGFVLVSVVMVLAVVSAILVTATLQMRANAGLSRTRADLLGLQGLADGIARLVAYDLSAQRIYRAGGLGLPDDGTVLSCRLDAGRTALVSIQDQGRLIDLNKTPRPAMEEAFRLLGVPDRTAIALAAEIVDYRDADDVPEPNGGAERPQYQARGLAYGPRNADFVGVDEIDRLPSMTREIAALLAPAFTVHNEGGRFDLATLVRRLRPSAIRALPASAEPIPSPRQVFGIAVAVSDARARAGRTGVYVVGGSRTGTNFVVWRQSAEPAPATLAEHRACPTIRAVLAGDAAG